MDKIKITTIPSYEKITHRMIGGDEVVVGTVWTSLIVDCNINEEILLLNDEIYCIGPDDNTYHIAIEKVLLYRGIILIYPKWVELVHDKG